MYITIYTHMFTLCMLCVCTYIYLYVCMCVYTHIHTHTHNVQLYIQETNVCVCKQLVGWLGCAGMILRWLTFYRVEFFFCGENTENKGGEQ